MAVDADGRLLMINLTPADISDPQEVIARAQALSAELATTITPGFEALVAQLCQGTVGAVFCLEASRLARNGRDRHHLIAIALSNLGTVYAARSQHVEAEGIYRDVVRRFAEASP